MIRSISEPPITNPASYTVLIVESAATDRELYRSYLLADSSCHYTILESTSAAAAMALCQQLCQQLTYSNNSTPNNSTIDGIIINDVLPDATGLEFMQALRDQSGHTGRHHPSVVIVTDQGDLATAVRAIKLGAEDYLEKQMLTPEQLQLAMQNAIKNGQLQLQQQEDLSRIQQLNQDLANRVNELQTLIDIIPVGIAIAPDPGCAQMQCNASMRQMLGVCSDYNISKSAPAEEQPNFRVFQNGQEIPSENLPMQIAARLGIEVRGTEIEIRLPDGTARQLLSYATPLHNDQHEIRGVVGAFLDITERKQIEAELRDREEQLRASEATIRQQLAELENIYATAPVGLCFHNTELRYVRINARLAEIDGVSAADHLGRTVREVLPELADTLEPLHHRVIETGEPILNIEIHGTTKAQPTSERDWIASYYPLKDSEGQVLGVNVTVQEITTLKQVQAEREQLLHQLEIERSFLEQILQQMPSGVAIAEAPSGKLLFHNDEAIRLIRHSMSSANTCAGYAEYGALHADGKPYQPEEYPIARSVLLGEVVKAEEMHYRRGDGTKTIFSVNAAPIVDQSGVRIAAVSTFEDISERKQIEVEHAQLLIEAETARTQAEAANRSKDEFVAMVAHELRSPLNAILGWAKLLQTHRLDTITTNKALETIVRNTQAQVQLVEDLLDLSRMVRGTLQLIKTPVDLAHVIETALETVCPIAEAKQIQLKTQIHTTASISGDFDRLQQVVLNLLTNAIKFTPEGGKVQVVLDQQHTQAQIQVIDTGKGISPDFLPHIFERFRQDQQTATAKQGLGLGLAIVKHIVEMHNGTVTVESQGEEQGATFTVMLPLSGSENEETGQHINRGEQEHTSGENIAPISSTPQPFNASVPLAGIRVLLVDDEPDMLSLTAFILEQYGAVVQTATNVISALEQLSKFQPNILFSDIAMPGQDGYELLQQMRLVHPKVQIPAIALTAYASEARREESLRAGFQQHLTKPVEPEQLVAAILRAIGRRRL